MCIFTFIYFFTDLHKAVVLHLPTDAKSRTEGGQQSLVHLGFAGIEIIWSTFSEDLGALDLGYWVLWAWRLRRGTQHQVALKRNVGSGHSEAPG